MNKTEYRKALRTGNLDAIKAGLDGGIDVNWQLEKGETALHKAAGAEISRLVDSLILSASSPTISTDAQNPLNFSSPTV